MTGKPYAAIRSGAANPSPCPACGKMLDSWTGAHLGSNEPPTPEPGDPTVCGYCATILVFADYHCRLRMPTPEETAAMQADREAWDVLQSFQEFARERRP